MGKIGQSKEAYILPVAERKDGIKSFFAKQASPTKPKKDLPSTPTKPKNDVSGTPTKLKGHSAREGEKVKAEPETPAKRKASQEVTEVADSEEEPSSTKKPRQGGKRTKVVRAPPPEPKDQKSITSFFKSPKK